MEKYSVLMSVYAKENAEFLKESMDSVFGQTSLPDEFVVVCDGPLTAHLEEIISGYEKKYPDILKIVRLSENKGLGIALNEGMKVCTNDIVARMDSDDVCMSDRMERQLMAMIENNADIISGTVMEFSKEVGDSTVSRKLPHTNEEIKKFARRRNPFNHPAVMYRKSKVEAAGGYIDFPLFEDYHLWVRMLMNGCVGYNIEAPVLYMRSGDGMYNRRGGIGYVKQILKFRTFLLRKHFIDIVDFLVTAVGHSLVAIVPVNVRKKFYEKVLRK